MLKNKNSNTIITFYDIKNSWNNEIINTLENGETIDNRKKELTLVKYIIELLDTNDFELLDYNSLLDIYYNEENKEERKEIAKIIYNFYGVEEKCPRCHNKLFKSDLEDYSYLCLDCDENFYSIETNKDFYNFFGNNLK